MTFEQEFNSRVNAFLRHTGLSPTALGLKALGDPNLMRQIGRGRSPSLRTADRVLAFIAAQERSAGGARAPPSRLRRAQSAARTMTTMKHGMTSENTMTRRTRPATRLLRVSEVQARTGLARSTIYEWSAAGRFPPAVRLSARAVRWIEADVDEWTRERIAGSGAMPMPSPNNPGKKGNRR
jgi:prophage regulatory protein